MSTPTETVASGLSLGSTSATQDAVHVSPTLRAWLRFRSNRLGLASLIVLGVLFLISLLAEVVSNDRPLAVRYQGAWYFPVFQDLPETTFGGQFPTRTDFHDPQIKANLAAPGNFAVFPFNRHHYKPVNFFAKAPAPAPPSAENLLGTDDKGRDLLARLLYGFRVSLVFAILVAGLLWAFATYVFQLNQQAVALYVAKNYREKLFAALIKRPYLEIRRRPAGDDGCGCGPAHAPAPPAKWMRDLPAPPAAHPPATARTA